MAFEIGTDASSGRVAYKKAPVLEKSCCEQGKIRRLNTGCSGRAQSMMEAVENALMLDEFLGACRSLELSSLSGRSLQIGRAHV